MPATVINGAFSDSFIGWPSAGFPGTFDGFAVVPNTTNITQTFVSTTLSGTNPNDFFVTAGQFPVTVNPGQSALIHVTFTPRSGATSQALVTISTNTPFTPTFQCNGFQTGNQFGPFFPSYIGFPTTKVGQTTTFANGQIINTSTAAITVNSITLTTGTDFFIVGAPVVPFVINAGAASAVFSIQFTPTVTGSRIDFVNVAISGGGTAQSTVAGSGSTLQSAFNLTGGTQGALFAFPGAGAPTILLASPTNLNTEEASSFVKLHDFQQPNVEKMMMRIRGHYEDLGSATLTFTAKARRVGQPDENIQVSIPIGTSFADGWIREFTSEPVPITGELIQLTGSRAANSGPVSLIDYMPQWETKGEVIGGT